MADLSYVKDYCNIDFRKNPHLYKVGKGEQGVLMAEPYKSEIGQHWRFRTPDIAKKSGHKIYAMFKAYVSENDFVGADMARKYLQMGWTRARRYANHPSGKKYDAKGNVLPQAEDHADSLKAQSAQIFKGYYDKARANTAYLLMKQIHKKRTK